VSAHAESPRLRNGWVRATGPRGVGIFGIALGALSFWLALPPVHARNALVPVAVGIVGAAAGIWAASRGERRLGWGAITAALLGIVGGILATRSSITHLDIVVFWGALVTATLRWATPLTFAAIGGMFSERSGVVNIGLEGMMLTGAFFGALGADKTGSWAGGLLIAMAAGGALALIHAFFAIHLRADQIVGGTAINFLALGLTGYLYVDIYGEQGTPTDLPAIPDVQFGWLQHVPPHQLGSFLDNAFGQMNLMVWLMFPLLIVSYIVMFKTPIGLRIRAVGEHPRAADTVGISVYAIRYSAVVVSGILAALGGAYLSIGFVHSFSEGMTNGRGFIALAALIFGGWRPFGAFGAALLFGFSSALALRLPDAYGSSAGTLFQALPYVLTLIAVAGVIGRSIPPAAIGRPYKKQ
jgi:general nucleoside transport system permease protein